MAQQNKVAPDWERIEADYRAGLLSVREIAASQGITHTAIQKRAKAGGWERDLSAKIKAKADSLVAKREVASMVATARVATDQAIVEANAHVIADIRMAHRTDITRGRALVMSLLSELETQTGNLELFERIEEMLNQQYAKDGEQPSDVMLAKLNEGYRRAMSLSGRTGTMKSLADSIKTLIGLEREAYGINVDQGGRDPNTPSGLSHFYGDSEN